jgi:hypothetical protein
MKIIKNILCGIVIIGYFFLAPLGIIELLIGTDYIVRATRFLLAKIDYKTFSKYL